VLAHIIITSITITKQEQIDLGRGNIQRAIISGSDAIQNNNWKIQGNGD
jgi:hypothetical protein